MKVPSFLAVALVLAVPALGKPLTDPGAHFLHDVALTMPKLKAYDAAYDALMADAAKDKSLKADVDAASAERDPTIADTIAKMDHHPRVYAYFQKHGLSKQEAALVPLALLDACMAVQYPQITAQMPGMIAQGQIDFCKANDAQVKALHFMQMNR